MIRLPDLRDDAVTPLWPAEILDTHGDKLQPATFGTIAHRALDLIMRARIDGVTRTFADPSSNRSKKKSVMATLISQRAQPTLEHGVRLLVAFAPRQNECRVEATVAGQAVGGYIDSWLAIRPANVSSTILRPDRRPTTHSVFNLTLYRFSGRSTGERLRTALSLSTCM